MTGHEERVLAWRQTGHTAWPHTPDTRGGRGPDTDPEQTEHDTRPLSPGEDNRDRLRENP